MTAGPADRASGRLRDLFEDAGATWLELPILQPADAFLETAGEDIRRRMFVTEGGRGERLALRPDFTIPVCLYHLSNGSLPMRYAYEGAVFRRSENGSSERLETGYEDIGRLDRTAAEVDAIALATEAVEAATGEVPQLRLGDIGLFSSLLSALDLPSAWVRRLRLSFGVSDKMNASLDRLASPNGAGADKLPGDLDEWLAGLGAWHDAEALIEFLDIRFAEHGHLRGGGRSSAEIARRFLEQQSLRETHLDADRLAVLRDYLSIEIPVREAGDALAEFAVERGFSFGPALDQYRERTKLVERANASRKAVFTAAFGRPLDYYTGLVFELSLGDRPGPIAGGGRYDGLMRMLGAENEVPAIGFTVQLQNMVAGMASK